MNSPLEVCDATVSWVPRISLEFQSNFFLHLWNAGWGEKSRFAADIFNDLHAEAMTLMGCYHDLKARVTKLELVLPAVEKSLLSAASHLRFIYSPGMYVCMYVWWTTPTRSCFLPPQQHPNSGQSKRIDTCSVHVCVVCLDSTWHGLHAHSSPRWHSRTTACVRLGWFKSLHLYLLLGCGDRGGVACKLAKWWEPLYETWFAALPSQLVWRLSRSSPPLPPWQVWTSQPFW
jgi:hypothetical protein